MSESIYKYCPRCAGELKWKQEYAGHAGEPDRQICAKCGHILYDNSTPTASALIINNKNEALLARRAWPPKKGQWDALGGFLENGEDPVAGVKRELKEEIGVTIKNIKFLGIYIDDYYHNNRSFKTLNIYYVAKIAKGTPRPTDDVAEVKWFALNKLPKKIAFPSVAEALGDLQKYNNSDKP